ncbi:MAG: MBL fold metallo-hydrolase [Deltaproteobacteria bacterium]|nr:MBL fold metallo-hydrolase [Deltaproteobacteria bacterium]
MELVPIVPHLFLIPGAGRGRFPFSHCLLADSSPVTLIDAGCGVGILAELLEMANPEQVIVSHSHPDHCAGCSMLEDRPIVIPRLAADSFGRKDLLAERFVEPGPLATTWKSFVTGAMGFEDCSFSDLYDDGTTFRLGELHFVAISAPGHTKDHMALFESTTGVLISFDVDLTPFGPWYGHRESSIEAFRATIQTLMDLEPRTVVSSHMGIIRDHIQERFRRYLHVLDAREGAIVELVRAGRSTLDELVEFSPIYGGHRDNAALTRYWEGQMIAKHLESLVADGRVIMGEDGRYENR